MKKEPCYFLLTGKISSPRRVKNHSAWQFQLKEAWQLVHTRFEPFLLSRFNLISEDEFQGLWDARAPLLRLVRTLQEEMAPYSVAFGIGYGTLSTPILTQGTFMMDGEVFHRSREVLSRLQTGRVKCPVVFHLGTDWAPAERLLNLFLRQLRWKPWTARQKQVVGLYRSLGTQEKVAKQLGITRQAVSDILHSARYYIFEEAIQVVDAFLSTLSSAGKGTG